MKNLPLLEALDFSWSAAETAGSHHKAGKQVTLDFPLLQSDRSLFVASLLGRLNKKIVYVVPDARGLPTLIDELKTCLQMLGLGGAPVVAFPRVSATPFDSLALHANLQAARAEGLSHLYGSSNSIIIVPAGALLWGFTRREKYSGSRITLAASGNLDADELAKRLVEAGYQRRQLVQEPGEFAIRGFIVDVFSPNHGFPVRLELFGDSVESLRLFNPADQKSLSPVSTYELVAMRATPGDEDFEARLRGHVISNSRLDSEDKQEMLEQIVSGEDAPWYWNVKGSEALLSTLDEALGGDEACLVLNEPDQCRQQMEADLEHWRQRRLETGTAFKGWAEAVAQEQIQPMDFSSHHTVNLSSMETESGFDIASNSKPLEISTDLESLQSSALQFIVRRQEAGRKTIVVLNSSGHGQRLSDNLYELGVQAHLLSEDQADQRESDLKAAAIAGHVILLEGVMRTSFQLEEGDICFLSHEDVFGKSRKPAGKRKVSSAFSLPVEELKTGDHIVHEDHGIGVFTGLKRVERGEEVQEFIQIEYSGGDRLLIPVEKMGRVQRYSSIEGVRPRLDKLGGTTWQKVKRRVKKALREMAGELINLYAIRKTIKGFPFLPDNNLMREFEESFPHVETSDQQQAMEEIKADMENEKPMDRLLCGDVGYGKTELALRAAVKAAISGKQAALLSPTTILAQQHYETFNERFKGFPFKVEVMSRFRSRAEQKEVLAKVAAGQVNVLVGTHRILSKDVVFKDLGLLIIDEEQRFGVGHKEKLKQMRKRIDVLSLTATPIPRTLNMSIAGIREMSLIQTPPSNRMAIETRVLPFREEIVRSAVEQELNRQGQVFYLRNRVEGIEEAAARIQRLVADSRPVIAHAQMSPDRLEKVMRSFIEGDYNVLVSTTIIENGIDIPNANTLIVERADRFGLSQLYQIRGRVGRSNRSAYAYFLVPSTTNLTEDARRRLKAIREFSDLGSGFRIAAMDLEIRGAGTLLGGEQSGHIEAVGFNLYNRMLEKTVKELQGEGVEEEFETQFQLDLNTHIPSSFIEEAAMRIKYYRGAMEAENEIEIESIADEMHELFGPLPESVKTLVVFARVRLISRQLRIQRIERHQNKVSIRFSPDSNINAQALAELLDQKNASFSESGVLSLEIDKQEHGQIIISLESILRELQ